MKHDQMRTQNQREQKQEKPPIENPSTWVKPGFKVIRVSFECSAYAGAL